MTEQTANTASVGTDEVAELRSRAEQLEARLHSLQQESDERLIRAEMKAEAIRAGMVDLDGLKLMDLSAIKLNEHGEVQGAAQQMTRFRQSKPWLFGSASSSSNVAPPSALPPRQKRAAEMTEAEYKAARAALVKQRY